jgi:tRNA A-37 threonylcarbamoyl transferase component Bud32
MEANMSTKSLGEPIPGTGNLYAWGEGQILKFYGDGAPEGWVRHLGRMERAIHAAGLSVPAVGDIVEIDGGLGQVYERIEGGPMADALMSPSGADADTIVGLARTFARVHAEIHACYDIPEVPLQRELLPSAIRRLDVLSPDLKDAVLGALDELPDGDRLCHGDYHPYNVLMDPRGPVVIDWNNAHIGNPLEDVARSALVLSGVVVSQPSLRAGIELFAEVYLEHYCELSPGDRQQLAAWSPIVAAVRLCDGIPEIEEWLLAQIRAGLDIQG